MSDTKGSASLAVSAEAIDVRGVWHRLEIPTWILAAAIYACWTLLTWHANSLPWWIVAPLGAWLVAWHNSLQHEALHGHPTRRGWLNATLAYPSLGLWMPYEAYRRIHLEHHRTDALTSPLDDTESFYVEPDVWQRLGRVRRAGLILNNTLLGRLTLGPALAMTRFWHNEARRIIGGDRRTLRTWLGHACAVAAILYWVIGICEIPFWAYALLFCYPGLSLTLLRSYLEHRPAEQPDHRTAIVEGGPLTRLLFLNNNLHAVHHAHPELPWYQLPNAYRTEREDTLARNGGYWFSGYWEVARRFLLRPKDLPVLDARTT